MNRFLVTFALLVAVLFAGCDTFGRRAKEKAATFESLTPQQREKLKRGVIEIGNTQDMVYIALGRPDRTRETDTPAGHETTWIYNSYHQEYEGNLQTGYRRELIFDPAHKRYLVYYVPIFTDVYSEHRDEFIRIVFRDGKVVQIEQPKGRTVAP